MAYSFKRIPFSEEEWGIDMYTVSWKNFKNIMVSKKAKCKKITYYTIPVTWNVEKSKICRDRKQINVCLGLKGKKKSECK